MAKTKTQLRERWLTEFNLLGPVETLTVPQMAKVKLVLDQVKKDGLYDQFSWGIFATNAGRTYPHKTRKLASWPKGAPKPRHVLLCLKVYDLEPEDFRDYIYAKFYPHEFKEKDRVVKRKEERLLAREAREQSRMGAEALRGKGADTGLPAINPDDATGITDVPPGAKPVSPD